ncbi:MAG: GNAT family N-acetyltransferase [Candidatus Paracaedibacteraceae bacterium]|nr:GNAT family N-acetyltransferase [Candidatus Paracaedibacteraceae bacterium]
MSMDKATEYNPHQYLQLTPYTNFMVRETIMLRPLFPNDYQALCPIYTDAEVIKYFGSGRTSAVEEVKKQALTYAQSNATQKSSAYHWAILTHVGIAGAVSIFYPHAHEARTEISYSISPFFAGRGLATRAAELVIDFIGGSFMATAHPRNKASIAILERKLGFKRVLTVKMLRSMVLLEIISYLKKKNNIFWV